MEKKYEEGLFEDFLFEANILKFGDFTLKSGRKSPFFLNLGDVNDGPKLMRAGRSYAGYIHDLVEGKFGEGPIPSPDYLFGPAYKGIPLVVATAVQLQSMYGLSVRVGSTRKEAKTHGEGTADKATFFMDKPRNGDHILIIEDVFTTGATKEEAVEDIRGEAPDACIDGIVIAVDRCEALPDSNKSAIQTFYEGYGIKTYSLTDIHKIKKYLHNKELGGKVALTDEHKAAIETYLAKWGPKEE